MKQQTELARSAISFTREATTRWNDRLAGSEACLACANFLEEEMRKFCDRVTHQDFAVRPGAFLGYIRINVFLYFLALLALFLQKSGIAFGITTLAVLITVLEFFFYKEFVDFLFPKKTGRNVFGTLDPDQEVKQQVIISAHHDSAHIFKFLEKNPLTYPRKVILGTLSQLAMLLISGFLFAGDYVGIEYNSVYWLGTGILTLAAWNVGHLWFFYDQKGTPGAGDNLVCTALAMEIGKYFASQKAQEKGLQHTRLIIGSWDAEECGLRGARAFTQHFASDLQRTKTYNFNLECMYDHQTMNFLVSDLNGFVPLSTPMAEEGVRVAKELGYELSTSKFPFLAGGTDAAEFAKAGIEATTLVAMDWIARDAHSAYHTTRDTVEAVDERAVAQSIAIGIQYVLNKDEAISA